MRNSYKVSLIILVAILLFFYVWPQAVNQGIVWINNQTPGERFSIPALPAHNFLLGLDLVGGAHLLYEADLSQVAQDEHSDAMNGIRDVVERRVNFFGISEPVVQVSGNNRLIVELAGISDINQAIQLIGETPFLEFREEKTDTQAIVNAQAQGQRLDEEPFAPTGLTGRHLEKAQLVFDPQTNIPQVSLDLNDEGAQLFAEITRRNVGKVVAIYLDGFPISTPVVESEITSGRAVITGNFSLQEGKLLAIRLNSGALPVPISLVSQQTVGASLGSESLAKSLTAGVWGLILVGLFMIVFYRLPGLMAVLALGLYVLIVLSIYKLLPVTLTLAGIAGFILSLGIAVDANVLIFARMREELKAGKNLSVSVNEGFSRAWLSIRDSHVTTLIGAAVLYLFTTSIVKGFALTLGIGVLTSLLTATVVTRALLNTALGPWFAKRTKLFS